MKKLLTLLLACCLLVTLAACRNSAVTEEETSSTYSDPFLQAYSSDLSSARAAGEEENTPPPAQSSSASAPSEAPVSSEEPRKSVKVTFPEGYSFIQIAKKLEENGICSLTEFMGVVNSYDYSKFSLMAVLPAKENRCYNLEGYLFPDTYEFYTDSPPEDVLGKMIRNTENRLTREYRARAGELGYNMDQILTIASLIQGEAGNPQEMGKVSSIIHNRLKDGMKLQMDSTINYVEKWIIPYASGGTDRFRAPYNTYKCAALPAGPIGNPGLAWIKAALYPDDTDYRYFVNDANGNYYYAATYEEHKENCAKAGVPIR